MSLYYVGECTDCCSEASPNGSDKTKATDGAQLVCCNNKCTYIYILQNCPMVCCFVIRAHPTETTLRRLVGVYPCSTFKQKTKSVNLLTCSYTNCTCANNGDYSGWSMVLKPHRTTTADLLYLGTIHTSTDRIKRRSNIVRLLQYMIVFIINLRQCIRHYRCLHLM